MRRKTRSLEFQVFLLLKFVNGKMFSFVSLVDYDRLRERERDRDRDLQIKKNKKKT